MAGKVRQLAKETVFYGLGSIVPRFLNFLLFPLHTRVFDPGEYGVVNYLYVFVAFLNIVYTFGMETAYFRFVNKPGTDPKRIFNVTQSAVVTISLIISALIIVFAQPLATGLGIAGKSHYVVILAIIMFIDAIVAIPFARLRQEKKPIRFAIARIINVFILIGLNLYFFVGSQWITSGNISFDTSFLREGSYGVGFVFVANLIANTFYLFFFAGFFRHWRIHFDREIVNSMLKYSYPVMITGLAGMTNEMFSRWTLEWWLPENFYPGRSSMYAIGLFSTAYKYAILMNLAIQAFRYAAEPFFFSNANDKDSPELFARVNHYFVIFLGLIFVGVTVNLDALKLLVAQDYYEALFVVPVLLLSYIFLGVYYNYSVWFKLTDKTQFGTYLTVGGAIITIALNFVLIPLAGFEGSSWASLTCYAAMTVACAILGQKHYPVPYRFVSDSFYILLAIVLYTLTLFITIDNHIGELVFHISLVGIYLAIVYLFERNEFRTAVR